MTLSQVHDSQLGDVALSYWKGGIIFSKYRDLQEIAIAKSS